MTAAAPSPRTSTRVPAPGDPLQAARLALAAGLMRDAPSGDEITFRARCPACGRDSEWRQERVETRLHTEVRCSCG
jgi:hypothetical protein